MNAEQFREMNEFLNEKDMVLLSLDEKSIREFIDKYNIKAPTDPAMFWVWIHKVRYNDMALPAGSREYSERWLKQRGFSTSTILHEGVKHGTETE